MKEIRVLDCTLRDGGYCNDCQFGFENTKFIIDSLLRSGVDIIECGFLTQKVAYKQGVTRFNTLEQVKEVLPQDRQGKTFVILMDYGACDVETIPDWDGSSVDGIRVTFHKKDMLPALEQCRRLKEKGYKTFLQPMVALRYTDAEYLELIRLANEVGPYAFYLVDSFGTMKRKDMLRFFYMIEHNLREDIVIGFHSHNNLQLAYANAQTLVDLQTSRSLILDSSIMGMGRGAGNLNSELFLEYLNDNAGGQYRVKPLLRVIDRVLNDFYQQNQWGYSLPNYLSASHNAHPNYALFLTEKNTLTVEDIDKIFDAMAPEKRGSFDRSYAQELYLQYMERNGGGASLAQLKEALSGKRALVIAPGKSAGVEAEKIVAFAGEENVVSIGVNFDYPGCRTDYIFLSNLRRQEELGAGKEERLIVASNIPEKGARCRVDYASLLNPVDAVKDNAGLMLLKLLIQLGVKEIWLAGMDGYSHIASENYAQEDMRMTAKVQTLDAMNQGMCQVLRELSQQADIRFLTTPKYVTLG